MVELDIGGQRYRIASPYDSNYVEELAAYLNAKLDAIQKGSSARLAPQAMVLVALDVVDEYFKAKAAQVQLRDDLRQRLDAVIGKIDRYLSQSREPGAK